MKLGWLALLWSMVGQSLAIEPGASAPDFQAFNQDGKLVKFAEFKGHPILIYFYPKDDTPGCTRQACELRDQHAEFKKLGAVVLGISRQSAKSHLEFKKKHRLPFDLLVDDTGQIAKSFGVGTMPVIGLHQRQSILIGADGKVIKFYSSVDPSTHAQTILKDLVESQAKK